MKSRERKDIIETVETNDIADFLRFAERHKIRPIRIEATKINRIHHILYMGGGAFFFDKDNKYLCCADNAESMRQNDVELNIR